MRKPFSSGSVISHWVVHAHFRDSSLPFPPPRVPERVHGILKLHEAVDEVEHGGQEPLGVHVRHPGHCQLNVAVVLTSQVGVSGPVPR